MSTHPQPQDDGSAAPLDDSVDDSSTKRPFYRSPFFWGFIFGAVVLTVLRPFTRQIPDPPPVGAALPELQASEVDRVNGDILPGATIHHSASNDGVLVLTVVAGTCEERCRQSLEVASAIQRRMTRSEIPSHFVTVAPQTVRKQELTSLAAEIFPYATNWRLLAVDETDALAEVLDSRGGATSERSLSTISSEGYLWIVDSSGHLRGRYDAGATDVESEVYHRSLRILGRY